MKVIPILTELDFVDAFLFGFHLYIAHPRSEEHVCFRGFRVLVDSRRGRRTRLFEFREKNEFVSNKHPHTRLYEVALAFVGKVSGFRVDGYLVNSVPRRVVGSLLGDSGEITRVIVFNVNPHNLFVETDDTYLDSLVHFLQKLDGHWTKGSIL